MPNPHAEPIRIVVVGAGFAGLAATHHFLSVRHKHDLHITLIDAKPFFEFTPSVLRCFIDPDHITKITGPIERDHVHFVQGKATKVTPTHITIESSDSPSSPKRAPVDPIPFHYAVWAVGVEFTPPVHSSLSAQTAALRLQEFQECRQKIIDAEHILIVGGGAVGTELTAEIANFIHLKNLSTYITLATSSRGLLPRLPPRAGKYAKKRLEALGVNVVMARMSKKPGESDEPPFEYVSEAENTIEQLSVTVDLVFECTGPRRRDAASPLVDGGVCGEEDARADGTVNVTSALHLPEHPHVFVAGDAGFAPDEAEPNLVPGCEKTAYAALDSGKLAARNVIAMLSKPGDEVSLLCYPRDAFAYRRFPRTFVISLYKFDAIMTVEGFVMAGSFVAPMKTLIEKLCVGSLRGSTMSSIVLSSFERFSCTLAKAISCFSGSRSDAQEIGAAS